MGKKYKTKLDPKTGLLRIIALKDFSLVKKGNEGGLIEKEENLSQEGDCWVYDEARVYGNAKVSENAQVWGDVKIYDNAQVSGYAQVYGEARIYGNARICDSACVRKNAKAYENACVSGLAIIGGDAQVFGNAMVYGDVEITDNTRVSGNVKLHFPVNKFSINNFSIKDSKDYTILAIKKDFYMIPLSNNIAEKAFIFKKGYYSYVKNIKIIRQLYGKEI